MLHKKLKEEIVRVLKKNFLYKLIQAQSYAIEFPMSLIYCRYFLLIIFFKNKKDEQYLIFNLFKHVN